MASELSNSSSSCLITKLQVEESTHHAFGALPDQIEQLICQIRGDRVLLVREKLKENRKNLESHVSMLFSLAESRNGVSVMELNDQGKMLSSRVHNPLCNFSGLPLGSMDKEYLNIHEVVHPMSAKLPCVEKIPPYTTWIFLDRNQRMADDQSVAGKRRIYYDSHGSEALICSDSEEETPEQEEDKHEFSEGEDRILWMAIQEYGLCEEVLNIVGLYVGGTTSEIREHCNILAEKNMVKHEHDFRGSGENASQKNNFLEKSLSAALDSFDNLFCRRCLVFDCRLHGCSQSIINRSDKQPYSSESDNDRNPCSDQCYLRYQSKELTEAPAVNTLRRSVIKSSDDEGMTPASEETVEDHEKGKRKIPTHTSAVPQDLVFGSDDVQSRSKKPKVLLADDNKVSLTLTCEEIATLNSSSSGGTEVDFREPDKHETLAPPKDTEHLLAESGSNKFNFDACVPDSGIEDSNTPKSKVINHIADPTSPSSSRRLVKGVIRNSDWKPFEKELYLKGVEIFGRDSCLIARNLLAGLKTCVDVASFMYDDGIAMPHRAFDRSSSEENKNELGFLERELPTRSRLCRRRGRTRKLKYSWKSAGHPSIWKRIADGKNRSCKQYTPCGCQPTCGKQCPCLDNGTCCEKYCGCSKSCKNRFRGCHCAKSQCRSRQCPCFAAGRECDPDVCRNCWVSCGDGSFGEPPRRGDGQCGNMRLLLRQQQRILLGKSEVAGWGAFLKNPVNKNDYLGEYTGELISHREADKRGKIYDRANSSFLFDLNEQYVLDAYRKGDKLKFANHSADPNCYAKVMLVAGDHRVGIFAKERIEASEELFYDYRYGPDEAPAWARKPEGSKGDDPPNSSGRAKKHQ